MRQILTIAYYTFLETVRGRLFYLVGIFSALLILIGSAFAEVTIGDPVKTTKDFGIFSISVFSAIFIAISGSQLLNKELERKTIYNILSRPISRDSYLIGKYFGIWGTASALVFSLGIALFCYCSLLSSKFELYIFISVSYLILEAAIVAALLVLCSSVFVTPLLTGITTLSIFLAGRLISQLEFFSSATATTAAKIISVILPRIDLINVGDSISYGISPSKFHFAAAACYVTGYCLALIAAASIALKKRDFN